MSGAEPRFEARRSRINGTLEISKIRPECGVDIAGLMALTQRALGEARSEEPPYRDAADLGGHSAGAIELAQLAVALALLQPALRGLSGNDPLLVSIVMLAVRVVNGPRATRPASPRRVVA